MSDRMRAIAGLESDPKYAGGESGGSELATAIRRLLDDAKDELRTFNLAQWDHLGRILAGGLSAVAAKKLSLTFKAPREWYKGGPDNPEMGPRGAWIDHPSKLVHLETGATVYRSEPYELGEDGLRALVALIDTGWSVTIRGSFSDHFPGETVAVLVSRNDGQAVKKAGGSA